MKEKFEVDRYEGNQATYLRMEFGQVVDSDSECVVLDSDNYEGAIKHIEIPHGRTRQRNEALTEEEQTIYGRNYEN